MLCSKRSAIARTKIYALYVSVPVSVDTLVEALGRVVSGVWVTVAIDPEYLAAE